MFLRGEWNMFRTYTYVYNLLLIFSCLWNYKSRVCTVCACFIERKVFPLSELFYCTDPYGYVIELRKVIKFKHLI